MYIDVYRWVYTSIHTCPPSQKGQPELLRVPMGWVWRGLTRQALTSKPQG